MDERLNQLWELLVLSDWQDDVLKEINYNLESINQTLASQADQIKTLTHERDVARRAMELLDQRILMVYKCFDGCPDKKDTRCEPYHCTRAALAMAEAEIAEKEV